MPGTPHDAAPVNSAERDLGLDVPNTRRDFLNSTEMLATSYRDYEVKIREQLVRLFSRAGFDPRADIAGIVLNRWGHA